MARPSKPIKINIAELIGAFEDFGKEYFLDLETGEIIMLPDEFLSPEEYEKTIRLFDENPDRFEQLPWQDSHEGYNDMVAFTENVKDLTLQQMLWRALEGKGAFRRFKDVLLSFPEERERWFRFKDGCVAERVLRWIEDANIQMENVEELKEKIKLIEEELKGEEPEPPQIFTGTDGKLYFLDEKGKEHPITDNPELMKKIIEVCKEYFGKGEVK